MLKSFYLTNRLFYGGAFCILTFILSFSFSFLFIIGQWLVLILLLLTVSDAIYLFNLRKYIKANRRVQDKLSLGDIQDIEYELENNSRSRLIIRLIDELPYQFQYRKELGDFVIHSHESEILKHIIRPTLRGVYEFGHLYTYISNPLMGLVEMRITHKIQKDVAVVPSIIQMKKYHLQVFSQTATLSGIRRVRVLGENDEFEHIKTYSQGDHIHSINWKATSRKNQLMVNQYQNSRSQQVYCVIDKGRSMKMPFNGLSLLDYAINTSLAISNIILKKYDRAGLITFSDKLGSVIKAESRNNQLELITARLYSQTSRFKESNFELLFFNFRKVVKNRSIILFFTNFENKIDLDRNLQYFKSINRKHLLVVILFINSEIEAATKLEANVKSDIYFKTFANKSILDKQKVANTLKIHGIQTILTRPEKLSTEVINKYLEIKAKRMK